MPSITDSASDAPSFSTAAHWPHGWFERLSKLHGNGDSVEAIQRLAGESLQSDSRYRAKKHAPRGVVCCVLLAAQRQQPQLIQHWLSGPYPLSKRQRIHVLRQWLAERPDTNANNGTVARLLLRGTRPKDERAIAGAPSLLELVWQQHATWMTAPLYEEGWLAPEPETTELWFCLFRKSILYTNPSVADTALQQGWPFPPAYRVRFAERILLAAMDDNGRAPHTEAWLLWARPLIAALSEEERNSVVSVLDNAWAFRWFHRWLHQVPQSRVNSEWNAMFSFLDLVDWFCPTTSGKTPLHLLLQHLPEDGEHWVYAVLDRIAGHRLPWDVRDGYGNTPLSLLPAETQIRVVAAVWCRRAQSPEAVASDSQTAFEQTLVALAADGPRRPYDCLANALRKCKDSVADRLRAHWTDLQAAHGWPGAPEQEKEAPKKPRDPKTDPVLLRIQQALDIDLVEICNLDPKTLERLQVHLNRIPVPPDLREDALDDFLDDHLEEIEAVIGRSMQNHELLAVDDFVDDLRNHVASLGEIQERTAAPTISQPPSEATPAETHKEDNPAPKPATWVLYSKEALAELKSEIEQSDSECNQSAFKRLLKEATDASVDGEGRRPLAGCAGVSEALDSLLNTFPHFDGVIDHLREHVALQQKGDGAFWIPPLLLMGGPGIGKTFFLSELARLVGTSFRSIGLDGVSGANTLTGTAAHWSTGSTGLIFKHVFKAKTANPIFLLDEVDKASRGHSQYPVDIALLSILEPATAKEYRDEFAVAFPLDLRRVIWMASGNDRERIYPALLSRFDVLDVPNPNAAARKALTLGIFRSLRRQFTWGAWFGEDLEEDFLEAVVHRTQAARDTRRLLNSACARAVMAGRNVLTPADIPGGAARPRAAWNLLHEH